MSTYKQNWGDKREKISFDKENFKVVTGTNSIKERSKHEDDMQVYILIINARFIKSTDIYEKRNKRIDKHFDLNDTAKSWLTITYRLLTIAQMIIKWIPT